jgi:acetylglutamate kinase
MSMTEPPDLRTLPIEKLIERSQALVEALPYIRRFRNATIVIKYGGHAMVEPELKRQVVQDIALMALVGMNPVVVHGGGPEITAHMKKLGLTPQFVAGQRVTDAETLDVAEMVLAGKIGSEITLALNQAGARAVGLTGKDMGLITARKLYHQEHADAPAHDIGFVGEVARIDPAIIEIFEKSEIVPVISPIGVDEEGQTYNINADTVAAEIAIALRADKFILLTDVRGILRDRGDDGSLINSLTIGQIEPMIAQGAIDGGMIPKVRACLAALKGGVKKTHILDGRLPHSLLLEIFTDRGIGTQIVAQDVVVE